MPSSLNQLEKLPKRFKRKISTPPKEKPKKPSEKKFAEKFFGTLAKTVFLSGFKDVKARSRQGKVLASLRLQGPDVLSKMLTLTGHLDMHFNKDYSVKFSGRARPKSRNQEVRVELIVTGKLPDIIPKHGTTLIASENDLSNKITNFLQRVRD